MKRMLVTAGLVAIPGAAFAHEWDEFYAGVMLDSGRLSDTTVLATQIPGTHPPTEQFSPSPASIRGGTSVGITAILGGKTFLTSNLFMGLEAQASFRPDAGDVPLGPELTLLARGGFEADGITLYGAAGMKLSPRPLSASFAEYSFGISCGPSGCGSGTVVRYGEYSSNLSLAPTLAAGLEIPVSAAMDVRLEYSAAYYPRSRHQIEYFTETTGIFGTGKFSYSASVELSSRLDQSIKVGLIFELDP